MAGPRGIEGGRQHTVFTKPGETVRIIQEDGVVAQIAITGPSRHSIEHGQVSSEEMERLLIREKDFPRAAQNYLRAHLIDAMNKLVPGTVNDSQFGREEDELIFVSLRAKKATIPKDELLERISEEAKKMPEGSKLGFRDNDSIDSEGAGRAVVEHAWELKDDSNEVRKLRLPYL